MVAPVRHHEFLVGDEDPTVDFRIVGTLPVYAFSAITRGLSEVYPNARLTTGGGYFGIILGEMGEDLPEWAQP